MTGDRHETAANGASGYRQAFDRIRAEYLEMPGLRLTPQQVHRLTGVEVEVCTAVLQDLVRAQVLQIAADGTYLRSSAATAVRPPGHPSASSPR